MDTGHQQAPPANDRQIKTIKREQKKEGVVSFLVVFEGDANEKGQWVPETQLPADAVKSFREQKKAKKTTSSDSNTRKIKEIKGIIPKGDELYFVVRFREATKDEAIPKAVMHSTYTKDLLKFYESHMERVPVQPAIAATTSAPASTA